MENHSLKKSIRHFFHEEISGWKAKELAWLLASSVAIVVISLVSGDSVLGIITALTGIICTVLTGKGKISSFLFGAVNVILYSIVSIQASYYGSALGQLFFVFPFQIIGIFIWSKHWNSETHEVSKRHMPKKARIITLLAVALFTIIIAIILFQTSDSMPIVDSFTTVATVIATIVSVGMFAEQWWIWIAVNALTILMWIRDILEGSNNFATLILWVVYLINSIIMCIRWEKEVRATSPNKE